MNVCRNYLPCDRSAGGSVGKNGPLDGCLVVGVIMGLDSIMWLIEFSGRGSARTLFDVFQPYCC